MYITSVRRLRMLASTVAKKGVMLLVVFWIAPYATNSVALSIVHRLHSTGYPTQVLFSTYEAAVAHGKEVSPTSHCSDEWVVEDHGVTHEDATQIVSSVYWRIVWNYPECYGAGGKFYVLSKICKPGFTLVTGNNNQADCIEDVVDPDKSGGPPGQGLCAGNPINLSTGNKYQVENDVMRKTQGLDFSRHYNRHILGQSGSLGKVWRSTYDRAAIIHLTSYYGAVDFYRDDGRVVSFYKKNTDEWVSDSDEVERLEQVENSVGGTLSWRLELGDSTVEQYDSSGKLISITNPEGLVQLITYNLQNRVKAVTDSFGNRISFTYDASHRIATMVDPEGGVYTYSYDTNNNLISVAYPDASPGDTSDNPTRRYLYEDERFPHALTGIVDENGDRYATWTYDAEGRAISSEHADSADRTTLAYNADGTTTVTNALGKQTTYHFDIIHGVYKVTQVEGHPTASCTGANQSYTYDVNGFLSSKTDWNGNVTTYVHNDRGLETSRTEGANTPHARTITTEWHTDFRVPVRITDPNRITEFVYDIRGWLLNRQTREVR